MTLVSTAAFYDRAGLDMTALRTRAEALQTALSTGQRLTKSSDDPVGAAQLRSLARANGFAAIDQTTAARATSDLTLTDSALSSFASYVTRAQELATQAANGTLTAAQRKGIGTELAQMTDELMRLANTRDSAGHALFGGQANGDAYALDSAGMPQYQGTASATELPLGDGQTVTKGLTGPEFLNFGSNNLFAVVKGLSDALNGAAADPAQAARDALGSLDMGLESITTAQTVVGARLNWIDLVGERRTQLGELRANEEADVGGAELASTVTQLQQVMTVLEASQASFAKLAGLSLFDLLH